MFAGSAEYADHFRWWRQGGVRHVFRQYRRKRIFELSMWEQDSPLEGVSVSAEAVAVGSPKSGDMIARDPSNHADMWLITAEDFVSNYEPA